jgi:hypothetical protein
MCGKVARVPILCAQKFVVGTTRFIQERVATVISPRIHPSAIARSTTAVRVVSRRAPRIQRWGSVRDTASATGSNRLMQRMVPCRWLVSTQNQAIHRGANARRHRMTAFDLLASFASMSVRQARRKRAAGTEFASSLRKERDRPRQAALAKLVGLVLDVR